MIKMILISIFLLTGLSNENLIKQIRDEYNLINKSLDSFQKIVNNDIDVYKDLNPDNYSFESGEIYRLAIINLFRFYDSTGLRKAVVTFDGDRQELVSEYYYKNDSLFLVFKKLINYNSPKLRVPKVTIQNMAKKVMFAMKVVNLKCNSHEQ